MLHEPPGDYLRGLIGVTAGLDTVAAPMSLRTALKGSERKGVGIVLAKRRVRYMCAYGCCTDGLSPRVYRRILRKREARVWRKGLDD